MVDKAASDRNEGPAEGGEHHEPKSAAPLQGTAGPATEELLHRMAELEARNAALARYFDLFNLAPAGRLAMDADGSIVEANVRACDLLGERPGAVKGKSLLAYIFFEDLETYRGWQRQASETGTRQRCEIRLMKQDSTVTWVRLDAQFTGGKDAPTCQVVLTDISDQKEDERALRENGVQIQAKLNAILEPEGDMGDLKLSEIFDIPAIRRIMADFYSLTGIGACIMDLEGNFLFATDWEEICARFHRVNPESAMHCRESDTVLSQDVAPGTWKTYRCKNNMREVVTPIFVGGKHIGNLFLGRFLFDDEPLDTELIRDQAKRYGFDEEAYMAAYKRMPRFSREKIDTAMRFYMHTVEMVAGLSHGNLRLARLTESLRASEEKFRIIADHTVNWEAWFGPDGRCIWVNPATKFITGYTVEEVMAMSLSEFIGTVVAEEDRELFASRARQALERRPVRDFEFRYVHRNGVKRWAITAWHPVHDGRGDFVGIRASGRDIHDQKCAEAEREKLEGQLLKAQRMEAVGQLAGGVAHDFNNLLHVILGYTAILKARLDALSEEGRAVRQVHRAAERAADLTRQLLAFSRRQVIQPVTLDLNGLIQGVLKMIRVVIGERTDLVFIPGLHLKPVHVDRGQMEQVLMNLCMNARDAMPRGGTLTIETKNVTMDEGWCARHSWAVPGSYAMFSVSDTGCGMDESTHAQIFEPFFTTKDVGQGTGLGLAMVYGIVKHHSGIIDVESEPGRGAAFRVYLPVADHPSDTPTELSELGIHGGSETVLVAEDEEMVRDLVRSLLEEAGYSVITAADGAEAVDILERNPGSIDLALLDVMMPKFGGREVMDHIFERSPRTRILFSSAYSQDTTHVNFVLKQGLNLVVKPYSRAELLKAVRGVLDSSKF